MVKRCEVCDAEFEASSKRQKYCGKSCYLQSQTTAGRHKVALEKNRRNMRNFKRFFG